MTLFNPIWIWGPNFVSSLVVQSTLKRTFPSPLWFLYFDLEIPIKERCSASKFRDDSHSPNHCSFPHHASTRQHTGDAELIWDYRSTCFPFKSCDGQAPWLGSFIADFFRINEAANRSRWWSGLSCYYDGRRKTTLLCLQWPRKGPDAQTIRKHSASLAVTEWHFSAPAWSSEEEQKM